MDCNVDNSNSHERECASSKDVNTEYCSSNHNITVHLDQSSQSSVINSNSSCTKETDNSVKLGM